MVLGHQPAGGDGGDVGQPLRQALDHRAAFPRHQGSAIRHGTVRYPHRRATAPRPSAADQRLRHRTADTAGRRRRKSWDGPLAQVPYQHKTDPFLVSPRLHALRLDPEHAKPQAFAPHAEVQRGCINRCHVRRSICHGEMRGSVSTGLGHTVKLIAAEAVKPFVKKGKKNDAADAAAICEAASRPDAKFVPAKSVEQQGILALHAARSLLVKQQTMLANAMRSLATEFGVTVPKGIRKLDELMTLVGTDENIPKQAKQAITGLHDYCNDLSEGIETFEA